MSLRNLEFGGKEILPLKHENSKLLTTLKRKVKNVSWEKIIRIIDKAIADSVKNNTAKLTWCCTASMLGENSPQPHGDIEYVWSLVKEKMGDERLCIMTIGTLVQWRISLREEEWYCNSVETCGFDEIDKMPIYYYQYWIKS